jgi:hypothetical protein
MKRTAAANGGVPLGKVRFQRATGIKEYDWGKYWARYSDVQRDAGFTPNSLTAGYGEDFLIEKVILLMRELNRFPTKGDFRLKDHNDPEFPSKSTIENLGSKTELVAKIHEYAKRKSYTDIVQICEEVIASEDHDDGTLNESVVDIGEVYLFKSGRYYKIGMTTDTVRRGTELRIQLPESLNLIHSIKTDDPSGVEAYWHRRFELKRMNGEWFDLSPAEVKAFKAWRRIA